MLRALAAAFLSWNLCAFVAMGFDKWRAARGGRRVPERWFFAAAALLGAPGVWLGARQFRHKTVKGSFRLKLLLATLVNAVWVALLFLVWKNR